MPPVAGGQLGPYLIERELGRGGMGVVYLARDTRLERDVAVKALPEQMAADPERLARFEREARSLAQLSHPSIASIYGVEEHAGARYLVLEYIEGETLEDRLDRGPIPPDEAVELAAQIANALAAAHDAGVIHRDLKPANVIVTPEGRPVVLDFGLARIDDDRSTSSVDRDAATLTTPAHSPTIAGVIMGTAAYMSPEQARGRRVDKRSDVWSFGVVLYEMLTGLTPFKGETVSDSIGAILHKDIDLEKLPTGTPANVARVLRRCVARDRDERYRDLGDARLDLLSPGDARTEPARPSSGIALALAAAVVAGVSGVGVGVFGLGGGIGGAEGPGDGTAIPAADPGPTIVFSPELNDVYDPYSPFTFRVSPTERLIAWVGRPEGSAASIPNAVYTRDLSTGITRRLEGTEHAEALGFSPDGSQIVFFWDEPGSRRQAFRRVPTEGGGILDIVADREGAGSYGERSFAWTEGDVLLVLSPNADTLFRIDINTGREISSHPITGNETVFLSGKTVMTSDDLLFFSCFERTGDAVSMVAKALDLTTYEAETIATNSGGAMLVAPDTLVFTRGSTLCFAPWDLETRGIAGAISPLIPGLVGETAWDVSPTGDLILGRGDAIGDRDLVIVDRDGNERVVEYGGRPLVGNVAVTPSGDSVLATLEFDLEDGAESPAPLLIDLRTGFSEEVNIAGVPGLRSGERVLPDGRIAVVRFFSPAYYVIELLDPTGLHEPVVPLPEEDELGMQRGVTMTPDGRYLVFEYLPSDGQRAAGLYMLDLEAAGEPEPVPIVVAANNEASPQLARDGRWLAFAGDQSGRLEVYVRPFDPTNPGRRAPAVRVSQSGGDRPFWSNSGEELFFLTEAGALMSARVSFENGTFSTEPPAEILAAEQLGVFVSYGSQLIDALPGDDEFVFIREAEGSGQDATSFVYILNWTDGLPAIPN
ncbi:MAG: protein kinase [Planctomycetota bacterium]